MFSPSNMLSKAKGDPTFDFEHVEGIGGTIQSGPQGVAFDPINQMLYPTGTNGGYSVKKVNLSGTELESNLNQNGRAKIQDGAVSGGKLYVPYGAGLHTVPDGQTGYVIRFDLDLNYEAEYLLPMNRYATAIDYAHGYWWLACYDYRVYQLSADFSSVITIHDVSEGNKPSTIKSYGGMAWYGRYLFGAEHDATEMDIWYLEDDGSLTLHQELSTSDFDIDNGIAFDMENDVMYGSSRELTDDVQKYNLTIE